MLPDGHKFTAAGRKYEIEGFLSAGGQGEVYRASAEGYAGIPLALKKMHDTRLGAEVRRLEYLRAKRLDQACSLITAPIDVIKPTGARDWCGSVTRFRPTLCREHTIFPTGLMVAVA